MASQWGVGIPFGVGGGAGVSPEVRQRRWEADRSPVALTATPFAPASDFARHPDFEHLVDVYHRTYMPGGQFWDPTHPTACFLWLYPGAGQPDLQIQEWKYPQQGDNAMRGKWLIPAGSPVPRKVNLTLALNVSYHDGPARAEEFAKTNEYLVRIELPDGSVRTMKMNRGAAEEYLTFLDISLPLQNGVTRIWAWPVGTSAEGFTSGRCIEIAFGEGVAEPARPSLPWKSSDVVAERVVENPP